jgi:hypothetical protein
MLKMPLRPSATWFLTALAISESNTCLVFAFIIILIILNKKKQSKLMIVSLVHLKKGSGLWCYPCYQFDKITIATSADVSFMRRREHFPYLSPVLAFEAAHE